jgi:GNAT superfamily N-acetyltransferase
MISYSIKDGFENMDFNRVTEMLSQSYWVPGISLNEVKQSAENSAIVVGAFTNEQVQISYARAISDKLRFAYILDVFVDEKYRKMGIGQAMIKYMLNHPSMKDVYHWLLITKDAHEVYKKAGFNVINRPNDWMEIRLGRPKR